MTREESGRLATSAHRKPTTTERILASDSNHPIGHKISCIRTLWDRVETHCNSEIEKHHTRRHLYNVFQLNGYPRNVVRQYVKRRSANPMTEGTSQDDQPSRRSIPYIKGASKGTARILGRYGIQVGHKPCGTLLQLLMQPKGALPNSLTSDVVYRVGCKGCNAYYVGETRKALQSRLREHQGAVRSWEATPLAWMNTAETGHSLDFENAKSIDHGHFKGQRLVKEALHSGPRSVRLTPGTIPSDPDRNQSQGSTADSSRGSTRSTYGPTGGRSPHKRTELHGTNHARPARMMAEAGQTRDNPLLLVNLLTTPPFNSS